MISRKVILKLGMSIIILITTFLSGMYVGNKYEINFEKFNPMKSVGQRMHEEIIEASLTGEPHRINIEGTWKQHNEIGGYLEENNITFEIAFEKSFMPWQEGRYKSTGTFFSKSPSVIEGTYKEISLHKIELKPDNTDYPKNYLVYEDGKLYWSKKWIVRNKYKHNPIPRGPPRPGEWAFENALIEAYLVKQDITEHVIHIEYGEPMGTPNLFSAEDSTYDRMSTVILSNNSPLETKDFEVSIPVIQVNRKVMGDDTVVSEIYTATDPKNGTKYKVMISSFAFDPTGSNFAEVVLKAELKAIQLDSNAEEFTPHIRKIADDEFLYGVEVQNQVKGPTGYNCGTVFIMNQKVCFVSVYQHGSTKNAGDELQRVVNTFKPHGLGMRK